jgi:uncharacterized lipoprotein YddW (UPF0748 family)
MKHGWIAGLVAAAAGAGAGCGGEVELATTESHATVTDWTGGVTAANHPAGAGQYGVWYDATDTTFGTPSAATLDGAPAMRIDDGGFVNGVYAIYAGAIPATGNYRLEVTLQVVETGATATNGVDSYRIGAAVGAGAVHRGPNPSALAGLPISGSYTGLTDGDDTAAGPQLVTTSEFTATAGDDLLIAFGTDVTSGAWNQGSQTWGGVRVLVGAIELVPLVPDPIRYVNNDQGAPGYVEAGAWTTGGSSGYATTYRFAAAGGAARATWTTTLEPGFYDVETIYRAGTNRAPEVAYAVAVAGVPTLTTIVDQRFDDQAWVPLGLVELTATAEITVVLDAAASPPTAPGQVVIADAVRFRPAAGPPPIDPAEMRIASITVFDPVGDAGAIQSTINRLVRLHYNAVAVHTRFRGDATYVPNKYDATFPNAEPRNPAAGSIDVLEQYVTRGHAAGLKVFAYVNTHLVTEGAAVVTDPDHVVNTHPEWRTYAYRGGVPEMQTVADDPEGLWIDPALPAARAYLVGVIADIASNYAIDGVMLDRIRYPQTTFTRPNRDFGYHPDAIAAFNALYTKTGVPDPYDADWIEFRQRAVTRTVTAIHDQLAAIDPQLLLLAFPLGRFTDATQFAYQDWPRWLADTAIDAVLPQIYTADLALFAARLDEHRAAYAGDRLLGATLDAFRPGVDLAAEIELARTAGFAGSAPFRHGVMGGLGYLDDLEVAWDGIAPWPATPWKGADVGDLQLYPACSGAAPGHRRWRIHNPNAWSIEVAWWLVGTEQGATYYAPPGDSYVETETTSWLSLVLIAWRDEQRHARAAARIGIGTWCWE